MSDWPRGGGQEEHYEAGQDRTGQDGTGQSMRNTDNRSLKLQAGNYCNGYP